MMTIPPEGNSVPVEDIFLRYFPLDGKLISGATEGDDTVKIEPLGNDDGAPMAEAQQAVLRDIFRPDKARSARQHKRRDFSLTSSNKS